MTSHMFLRKWIMKVSKLNWSCIRQLLLCAVFSCYDARRSWKDCQTIPETNIVDCTNRALESVPAEAFNASRDGYMWVVWALMMYKSLNGGLDFDFNFKHISDVHDYNTRNKQNLYLQKANRNYGKLTFTYQGAMDWNVLPTEIGNVTVFKTFKLKLRNFLFFWFYIPTFIL